MLLLTTKWVSIERKPPKVWLVGFLYFYAAVAGFVRNKTMLRIVVKNKLSDFCSVFRAIQYIHCASVEGNVQLNKICSNNLTVKSNASVVSKMQKHFKYLKHMQPEQISFEIFAQQWLSGTNLPEKVNMQLFVIRTREKRLYMVCAILQWSNSQIGNSISIPSANTNFHQTVDSIDGMLNWICT